MFPTTMKNGSMLCASFNQAFLACGFDNGFAIYQCCPFQKLFSRSFQTGGVGIIEILGESNIIAMVGGGTKPLASPNCVLLWDDKKARFVAEINVNTKICSIRVTDLVLIIVTITNVYIYDINTLKKVQEYNTYENCQGLIDVNSKYIVIPGTEKGSLRILSQQSGICHLDAHDNSLRSLFLSDEGSLLATVSEKGTLIRLYNVENGDKYQVLRRGVDKANISHLIVSKDEKYVLCISDQETLHVFTVSQNTNATSLTSMFTVESKSVARMPLTEEICSLYMIDAKSIYLISISGTMSQLSLDDDMQLSVHDISQLSI